MSGNKNKKGFRWKLDKDETLKSVIIDTYLDTYHSSKDKMTNAVDNIPEKIKTSRYYNMKIWGFILLLIVVGIILIVIRNGIDDRKDKLKHIKNQIAVIQDERSSQIGYYFDNEDFAAAEESMNEILEILNDMQSGTDEFKMAEKLKKHLGADAVSDAYHWGAVYGTGYAWTGYINWISTDEDIVELVFILKNESTTQPAMYEFCEYSIQRDVIISRKEYDVVEN